MSKRDVFTKLLKSAFSDMNMDSQIEFINWSMRQLSNEFRLLANDTNTIKKEV